MNYYRNISPELKRKFLSEIISIIDGLEIHPEHHMVRYKNIQIAHANSFLFAVHFNISKNSVYVLNVLHHR
ncbi:MAG: hypothetical protein COB60_05600 [Flavobacteriaceae bacterium]|nr:MAG: hypothetical protein COB60_05600 [Flavobacteriaceae bacterium]